MFGFAMTFISEFFRRFILVFLGVFLPNNVVESNKRVGSEVLSNLHSIQKVQGLDDVISKESESIDLFDKNTASVVGFLFKNKGQLFMHSPVDGQKFSEFDTELVGGKPDGTILSFTFTEINDTLINGSSQVFSPATEYWTEVDRLFDEDDRDILEGMQFMLFKDKNIAAQVKITKEKVFVSQNDHGQQVPFNLFDQELQVTMYDKKCSSYLFRKKDNNRVEGYNMKEKTPEDESGMSNFNFHFDEAN